MNKKYIFLKIILIITCHWSVYSQHYSTYHYNEKNGLDANTIYQIKQDHKGYIWICTNSGIIKYDGNEFKKYEVKDGLSTTEILYLTIDNQNHKYLSNISNKPNYIFNDKIYNFSNQNELNKINYSSLFLISFIKKSNSIVISSRGSNKITFLNLHQGKVNNLQEILLNKDEGICKILHVNNLLYVFYNRFYNEAPFTQYKVFDNLELKFQGELPFYSDLLVAKKNELILSLNDSIFIAKIKSDHSLEMTNKIATNHRIKSLCVTNEQLWAFSYSGGLLKFNSDYSYTHLFKNEIINNVFVDLDSNIWISTESNGIFLLNNIPIKNVGIDKLKISKSIYSIEKNKDGGVYIGYNKMAISNYNNEKITNTIILKENNLLSFKRVIKIISQSNDTLFCISTENIYRITNFKKKPKTEKISNIFLTSIKDFQKIDNEKFYIATSGGLLIFKKNMLQKDILSKRILSKRILSIEYSNDSSLLIGTLEGLYILKKNTNLPIKLNLKKLYSRKINDIYDNKKFIYLATDSGVCIIKKQNKNYYFITKKDGLANNNCKKIKYYKQSLWVASNKGVSRIKLENNYKIKDDILIINKSFGLSSNFINDIMIHNDTLWVGTSLGLDYFNINKINRNYSSKINITKIRSELKEYSIYDTISLKPKNNRISFTFSNMNYFNEYDNQYEYRLLPNTKTWSFTKDNSVNFSDLRKGGYTFEVRSINNNSKRSKTESIKFTIQPKLVETWYFKLILIILCLGISYIIYRNKTNKLKKNTEINSLISKLELEAIKAQINPHFIYNCLNSIKNTIIKNENLIAEEQISIFAKLVRQTLTISQNNFISLQGEIEYLINYLKMEKIRFKDQLIFSIDSPDNLKIDSTLIPTMLIQPYVENAIKHGNPENEKIPTEIKIRFIKHKFVNKIICEIEDNGPGIFKSLSLRNSDLSPEGINISSNRAEKYNKIYNMNISVLFKEKEDAGTIVKLTIDYE